MREYPYERVLRDSRILLIFEVSYEFCSKWEAISSRGFFMPYWLKLIISSIQISFTGHQRNLKNVHSFDWNAACWEAISGNVKVCI